MAKRNGITDFALEVIGSIRHEWERFVYGRAVTDDLAPTHPASTSEQAILPQAVGQERDAGSSNERRRSFAEQFGWERSSARDAPERTPDHGIDH